jgi:hypothetical protein
LIEISHYLFIFESAFDYLAMELRHGTTSMACSLLLGQDSEISTAGKYEFSVKMHTNCVLVYLVCNYGWVSLRDDEIFMINIDFASTTNNLHTTFR